MNIYIDTGVTMGGHAFYIPILSYYTWYCMPYTCIYIYRIIHGARPIYIQPCSKILLYIP